MKMPLFDHPNALRVYGPAGAGKTRAGIEILRDHVEDGDFDPGDGIIVSFTRTAAHDIARRVADGREPSRYHCTLHALVKRYYGFDSGIAETRVKDFFEAEGIEYTASRGGDPEEWQTSADSGTSEGATLLGFWNWCRNLMIPFAEGYGLAGTTMQEGLPSGGTERLDRLWARYCAWKAEERLVDFTDMLEMALESPPGGHWPFLMLDEAQDSTPLQWAVVNVFARQCEVVYLLGDDDQAIYSWAGATPEHFLDAAVGAEDTLHINHRCASTILDEAQTFIRRNKNRHDKGMLAARQGGHIREDYDLPSLSLDRSTFVMGRAYYLLVDLMQELEARGYPFVDRRGSFGVNGKAALQYSRYRRLVAGDTVSLDEWRLLCDVIPSRGPWLTYGAKKQLKEMDVNFRARTMTSVRTLDKYGATDDLLRALQVHSLDPLGRVSPKRLTYLRDVAEKHGEQYLDAGTSAAICQVGPIHSFKGLEADHVVLHSGMPPAATREALVDPEPERRVFYVAITRAREELTHLDGKAHAQWREIL